MLCQFKGKSVGVLLSLSAHQLLLNSWLWPYLLADYAASPPWARLTSQSVDLTCRADKVWTLGNFTFVPTLFTPLITVNSEEGKKLMGVQEGTNCKVMLAKQMLQVWTATELALRCLLTPSQLKWMQEMEKLYMRCSDSRVQVFQR